MVSLKMKRNPGKNRRKKVGNRRMMVKYLRRKRPSGRMMRTAVAIPAIRMAAMMTIGVSAVEGKRPCPGRMMRMAEAHMKAKTAAMLNPIPRKTAVLRRQAALARRAMGLVKMKKDLAGM